jgi:hypothetical protein
MNLPKFADKIINAVSTTLLEGKVKKKKYILIETVDKNAVIYFFKCRSHNA